MGRKPKTKRCEVCKNYLPLAAYQNPADRACARCLTAAQAALKAAKSHRKEVVGVFDGPCGANRRALIPVTPVSKFCPGCKKMLTADDFHRDKSRSDGLETRCKECRQEKSSAHYHRKNAEDPNYFRDNSRTYHRVQRTGLKLGEFCQRAKIKMEAVPGLISAGEVIRRCIKGQWRYILSDNTPMA